MTGVARQHPPLETVEVSTTPLTDTQLTVLTLLHEHIAADPLVAPWVQNWHGALARQLRSVLTWREMTLERLAEDAASSGDFDGGG